MQLSLLCPTYPKLGQVRELICMALIGASIDYIITKLFSQLGNTPLHLAVERGHSEVVKQLLLSQTNLNIVNNVSSAISSVSTITLYILQ